MSDPHVLVAGAGPAGATAALLLARNGIRVTLVERETDFDRVFRGEGLMPSGADALHQMGLGGLLDTLPTRVVEGWELYIDGQSIMTVPEPVEELGDRAMRILPQTAFLNAVIDQAREHENFTFLPGVSFHELIESDGRIAGARVRGHDTEEIRADLVLGCDGRGSVVRTRAGLELKLLPEHYDILWFKLPAPERLQDLCVILIMASTRGMGIAYTSWDGRLQYGYAVPKGRRELDAGGDWEELLSRPAPDWLAEHLRAVRDAIEEPVRLNVMVGRCHEWARPGLLLLGDAAHPMSPVRAQGINVALRDVIVAANHLVPVLQRGPDPLALDAAAMAVQAERQPEIVRAQTLQYRDTRGINTRAAPLLIALGKHIGRRLGGYEWAQQAWLNQQRDLRFGVTKVELR